MFRIQPNVRLVVWLGGLALLLLMPETTRAQLAGPSEPGGDSTSAKAPAQPDTLNDGMAVREVEVELLLLKADWSQSPTAKQVEADIRQLLSGTNRTPLDERTLPGGAATLLFPDALVTAYREADFENLMAWMLRHGLVQQRIAFPQVETTTVVGRLLRLEVDTTQVPVPIAAASQVPQLIRRVQYGWRCEASMPYGGFPSAMSGAGSPGGMMPGVGVPGQALPGMSGANMSTGGMGMGGMFAGGMGTGGMGGLGGIDLALVRVQRQLWERESTTFPIQSVLHEHVVYSATADFRVLPGEVAVLPWYFRAEEAGLRQWVREQGVDPLLVLRTRLRPVSENKPANAAVEDNAPPGNGQGPIDVPPAIGPLRLPIRLAVPKIEKVREIGQDLLALTRKVEETPEPLSEPDVEPSVDLPPGVPPGPAGSDVELAASDGPPVTDAELDAARGRFAAAEQLTYDLAARARSLSSNSAESPALRERLQAAVRSAFELRMDLQKMEARRLQQQLRQVTANLAHRQQMADIITDNRVRELLTSPDLHWQGAPANPPSVGVPPAEVASVGRTPKKAPPSHGSATGTALTEDLSVPALPADSPTVQQHRETVRRLEAVMLAMHQYLALHQHFPPAVIFGKDGQGKVPHSWRVELLPHLGEQALYDEYDFDEPWDGPHNVALLSRMPLVYRSPRDAEDSTNTSVLGLVTSSQYQPDGRGPHQGIDTVFSQPGGTLLRQILDGTSNTIAIVEAKREIPWTKPEDILVSTPGRPLTGKLGSWFQEGWHAGFADGKAKWISSKSDEADVRALISIAGAEPVQPTLVPVSGEPGQVGSGP